MSNQAIPAVASSEPAAAVLQAAITLALATLCGFLYGRYRKPYFAAWAVAWLLYALRLGAILAFLLTERFGWLYWHQVITGWTGLALLWAALVFSRGWRWRNAWLVVVAFPVLWSYVAIYRLDDFLLAAGPAVIFLSAVTLWTARVFFRHHRQVGSTAAAFLGVTLALWGIHHLDYPFLRAQGVWNPWGYYLDILFVLAMGVGILLLVGEDLDRGVRTLSVLSGQLRPEGGDFPAVWLERALTLPAVRGAALWALAPDERAVGNGAVRTDAGAGREGRFVAAAGTCAAWAGRSEPAADEVIGRAVRERKPAIARGGRMDGSGEGYVAALPVLRGEEVREVLCVTGDARDPFAALDTNYLVALGHQIGAALALTELHDRLAARTRELERLASRMARQHEDERGRLSRELHDETAQVFAAVHMQLAVLRERAGAKEAERLDRVLALMAQGMRGIRSVTERLRPPLLDDLGLPAALRGLVDDFAEHHAIEIRLDAPAALPALSGTAEVALYRGLQEALSNVVRHAEAHRVDVILRSEDAGVCLVVRDDGRGMPASGPAGGGAGLEGMRERVIPIGGTVSIDSAPGRGVELRVYVPGSNG